MRRAFFVMLFITIATGIFLYLSPIKADAEDGALVHKCPTGTCVTPTASCPAGTLTTTGTCSCNSSCKCAGTIICYAANGVALGNVSCSGKCTIPAGGSGQDGALTNDPLCSPDPSETK